MHMTTEMERLVDQVLTDDGYHQDVTRIAVDDPCQTQARMAHREL